MRVVVAALLLAFTATAAAQSAAIVEDWSKHAAGAKGLPSGWTGQNWGSPKYDFVIEPHDSGKVLRMRSANEGSTISKEIKGKVDLKQTPLLEWSWKVTTLPKGGNSCKKPSDDQAAQVFVVWPRFPTAVRSRIIGYVWDSTVPAGTICKSEKTGTVTYVVVRSGPADLGKWFTERRNVVEDFKQIYGEDPESPEALSIAIDSNDTNSTAESFVGSILFRRP
jgi:Protein of unknown function (DUF3047)